MDAGGGRFLKWVRVDRDGLLLIGLFMASASETQTASHLPQLEMRFQSDESPPSRAVWGRLLVWMIGLGIAASLAYAGIAAWRSAADGPAAAMSTFRVANDDLLLTVTESGNVESAFNQDVKCKVAGGSTILWIIPDGTEVKQGDKLADLDASALTDQINTQKINCSKAQSLVIQARKNYEVAQISVREYLEGTYQQELQTAETNITIAEENLRSSKNSLNYSQRMFQRGYISQLELESQQFGVKRAELELAGARTARKVLEEFTKVKMLEDLRSQVETAAATLEAEQAAFELEEAKLKRLETQLTNCTILAPQDGMVVYANERGRRGNQSVTIEEGALVRDQQTILRLPDLSQMQVKVDVHETKVEYVKSGMRARINIQGREFRGEVVSVANQHKASSWWSGDVKEYESTVRIEGDVQGLRPGMTAEVEILVAQADDVLTVPVSAIVESRGKFFCWIRAGKKGVERRELLLGLNDDNFVEVVDGLVAGNEVIRNPRAVVDESRVVSEDAEQLDVAQRFGEANTDVSVDRSAQAGRPAAAPEPDRSQKSSPDAAKKQAVAAGQERPGLLSRDKDGDGKLSKSEAPTWMQGFFDSVDANSDGFVDQKEIDQMRRRHQSGGFSGRPSGGDVGATGDAS